LRMRAIEPLDARAEERTDGGPLHRDDPSRDGKPDAGVQPPERAPQPRGKTELDRCDVAARPHDPRELAHRRRGIVDVAQQVGEREVVEGRVREGQFLRAAEDDLIEDAVALASAREHVGALIETDDVAAIPADELRRDHAGAGGYVEDAIVGTRIDRVDGRMTPARVLTE